MAKSRQQKAPEFWFVGLLPDRIIDSLMFADRATKVNDLLYKVIPAYGEYDYSFGLAKSWDPATLLSCDSNRVRRDATCGPHVREVVSNRLRELIDRLAPDHAQWLPITLVHRRKALPWGPYWVANWTRKVDCWNLEAGARLAAEDFKRYNGRQPVPDDKLQPMLVIDSARVPEGIEAFLVHDSNILIISGRLKRAIQRAGMTGWSFDRVPIEGGDGNARDASRFLVHLSIPEEPPRAPAPARQHAPTAGEKYLRAIVGNDAAIEVGRGASASQIDKLERTLSVTLPRSYRSFLESCGRARIEGEHVLGIGACSDATKATRSMREWSELAWPDSLIVVAEDGRGGCYALDSARIKGDDCPVVYFDHELVSADQKTGRLKPKLERVKPGFNGWLKAIARTGSAGPY